jgi:hypothetical protein
MGVVHVPSRDAPLQVRAFFVRVGIELKDCRELKADESGAPDSLVASEPSKIVV